MRAAQAQLAELRREQQETAQRLETTREALSGARARRASLEQILNDRAYTADAVQKLFASRRAASEPDRFSRGGLAGGLRRSGSSNTKRAVEQFLRDELEYVVVESFDHARAGIALLREEMGGRATFFVDSLRNLNLPVTEPASSLRACPPG